MNIKIKKRGLERKTILIIWFFEMSCFGIIPLPVELSNIRYFLWTICAALWLYCQRKMYLVKDISRGFISKYIAYVFSVQIIISVYSMLKYNETLLDMYICAGCYLSLLLTGPLLIIFKRYGMEDFLDSLLIFQLVFIILVFIHCLIFNNFGISILHFLGSMRYGRIRQYIGVFRGFYFIYALYSYWFKNKKTKYIIMLILGIFMLFYAEMTRMNQIATICTLAIMIMLKKERTIKTIVKYIAITVLICFLINAGYVDNIISSFSVDRTINPEASSTIARLAAIEYFSQYTHENPLLGMGWVRPYTQELTLIFSGPEEKAFFNDLGVLGMFFRLGILGVLIFIILILRMFYIILKLDKHQKERILLIGLLAYTLFTSISLNCFDKERIMTVPLFIAIFEYVFYLSKKYKFKRNCNINDECTNSLISN